MEEHSMDTDLEALIRTRAYHLWENDPSPERNAEQHWEEARRQIEAEGVEAAGVQPPAIDQSADRQRGDRRAAGEPLQDVPLADARSATRQKR
jgi:hypothetical protein